MNLEQQVVSLELSKRLKELGVKQESLFYWLTYKSEDGKWGLEPILKYGKYRGGMVENVSAFTVAELGEMLPKDININWSSGNDCAGRPGVEANTEYFCTSKVYDCTAETEADARAKMLIYLLENKLITL